MWTQLRLDHRTWQRAEGDDQIAIRPSVCGTCRNKSDPWRPPSPQHTGPNGSSTKPPRASVDGWTHTSIHLSVSLSRSMFHSLHPFFFCLFVSKNTEATGGDSSVCVCVCVVLGVLSHSRCHSNNRQTVISVSARTINMSRYPLESQTCAGRTALRCVVFPACWWFLRWCYFFFSINQIKKTKQNRRTENISEDQMRAGVT